MGGAARAWAAPALCEGGLWPLSFLSSVVLMLPGKTRLLAFVLSNSENISCVSLLKHKIAENRELALWQLISRLVPEIA
jgi:hypothetical protein